jgi:CubicO group peptidase (beta-lactamase class C family)
MSARALALILLLLAPLPAFASGLPAAPPEQLGFSADRLTRIDAAMQRYVDGGKLAGLTIAIARDGKVAYLRSAGMADIAAGRPMREDTIARFYSMSKPITVAAAMMLVEEGRLRLDDNLADYLPEFRNVLVYAGPAPDGGIRTEAPVRPIRIRDLMIHTSGLSYPDYEGDVSRLYKEKDIFAPRRSLAEFSAMIAALPLAVQPGAQFHYGASIDILGRVIEVVSGKPFGVFLKERLFAPLGMNDTAFTVPAAKLGRFAEDYELSPEGTLKVGADPLLHTRFADGARMESGGGGLVSTVGDYLRFCQMLLNGGELDGRRLLAPKTVDLIMSGQLPPEKRAFLATLMPGYNAALGGAVLEDVGRSELPGSVGEYSWAGAAGTWFFIDRKEGIIAVLVTQMMTFGVLPLRQDLKALTYQALEKPHAR